MPKFLVQSGENVSYETVIVEAPTAEEAEDIIRQSDPRDLDETREDGDGFNVEASEATEEEITTYREVVLAPSSPGASDQIVPFKEWRTPRKVVIEVSGGVAEITSQPEGVEVEIIDHDNA